MHSGTMKTAALVYGTLLGIIVAASPLPGRAETEVIHLPAPRLTGGMPLMEALKERKTTREFSPKNLTNQQLADLLWAAFGINRPEDSRRTAPSAMNSQEVDLYVALSTGLYVYEPKANELRRVLEKDLRAQAGQAFSKDASVVLFYVANLPRLEKATPENRRFYAAFDAGCICQNVYLYCASAGLATVVHDLSRESLSEAMELKPEQYIVMAQAIGAKKP
jgi:nitroreductase